MKTLFLGLIISISFILPANAQDKDSPKAVYTRNNIMTAMYNIGVNLSADEIQNCSVEKYIGNLVSVSEGYPDVEVVVQTQKRKEYISLNTESMSMADRSNFFDSLLKKAKRVQIGVYMCGSGGFLYATSVKSLNNTTSKQKKTSNK